MGRQSSPKQLKNLDQMRNLYKKELYYPGQEDTDDYYLDQLQECLP